jgi:EAL domain-containing protein (putative c-di-GMP-specific phosphodiesterase class I)
MKAEIAKPKISELKSRGIQVHIDDFGTGYSSLSYLHRFAIDCLKIDRSFISLAEKSLEDAEIVKTILALARNLKMQVVAEGVETVAQAEQLRLQGCSLAQGFLFSRPLTGEAAEQLLESSVRNVYSFRASGTEGEVAAVNS